MLFGGSLLNLLRLLSPLGLLGSDLCVLGPMGPRYSDNRSNCTPPRFPQFSCHISVYMGLSRFTGVLFHTNTGEDWNVAKTD